jgi:AraC family transcriptional regulator
MDHLTSVVPVTHGERMRTLTLGSVRLTETRHSSNLRLPRHAHEHPAITFVLAGGFRETFGSITHECTTLSLLFKPAGAEHVNTYSSAGARSFIVEPLPNDGSLPAAFVELDRQAPQKSEQLVPLALLLYRTFQAGDDSASVDCEELAWRLTASAPSAMPLRREAAPWLQRVEELLRSEPQECWSLSALGSIANVHPVYLARAFRRHFGMSIGAYVRRRRIAVATRMLAEPHASPSRTAPSLGYADQSHFGRAFLRETGRSPGNYRRDVVLAGLAEPPEADA